MQRGYIKLWRKTADSGLLNHPHAWTIFTWILLHATGKEKTYITRGGVVKLNPGDFISSSRMLANSLGMTRAQVRHALEILESAQCITSTATHKFTVYHVVNWEKYQDERHNSNPPSNPPSNPVTTQSQPSNNPVTTQKQEREKERKREKTYGELRSPESISPPAKSTNHPPCPHLKIVEQYNRILSGKLPAVNPKLWNGQRRKHLAARWKEDDERQDIQWWIELFGRIRDTPFLTGENNRGWTADLGWIVRPQNFVKILEGKYGGHGSMAGGKKGNPAWGKRLKLMKAGASREELEKFDKEHGLI